MAPRLIQRLRKIVDFKTDVPRELKRQLRELEQGFADALASLADGIVALFTGLDGVDVTGNTIRSSRDVKIYTAGGNNLGGAAKADILRFELTAHATVTGFVAPGLNDTHRKLVVNASAYTLTFTHDATSTTANRLYSPHLVAFELRPSECTWIDYDRKSARWRVADQSQPFRIVRTLADLPAASGGDITLTTGAVWFFEATIDLGAVTLVIPDGCYVVGAHRDAGVVGTADPVCEVGAFDREGPFYVARSSGSGYAVLCTGTQNVFDDWAIFGGLRFNGSGHLYLHAGYVSTLDIYGGNTVQIHGTKIHQIRLLGAITGPFLLNGVQQHSFASPSEGTLVTIDDGVRLTQAMKLIGCAAGGNNKLLVLGTGIADSSAKGMVQIIGCSSPNSAGITAPVIPGGGLVIEACRLHTSPFSGFTALTAGVRARANYDTSGNLLQETPNGHIVKNNAGTEQTQRHYLKAGTGLEASDDGTNTVLSVSSSVTDTLTFADDATYGYELSAQLPVTSLPSSCVAAIRVACAWGVTAASGGAIGDINRDGSGWVYIQVTKNSGTLVQVEYTYDRLGTPVPEYHIVHEDLFDDGNNPATAGTFYVQLTSGQIEVFVRIPGTGTHSGATYEGTATMFVDSVHTRTALS